MAAKKAEKESLKQKLNAKIEKFDEITVDICDCMVRVKNIKPVNYFQNETAEILKEIIRNQAKVNQVLRSTIKYIYRNAK